MAQPFKGERVVVTARIPKEYFTKLDRYVKALGVSKTDFITQALTKALDEVDVEQADPDQEQLPITA